MKIKKSLIIILLLIFSLFIQNEQVIAKTNNVTGSRVVKYANKFVGNPYKWGGNSLTNGCDCSGFVVQVYKKFDVDLSKTRNSTALRTVGKKVNINKVKKGDIVCYNHHVAIYAGGGKIVEAQSAKAGITNTRGLRKNKVITVRRLLK